MIEPLASRFTRLERSRSEIEAELRPLSHGQLAYRPTPTSWSIGEVLDHVVRVESSILEGARKPGVNRTAWKARPVRRALTRLVFLVGARIRVPERVKHVTPERGVRAEDVLVRWEAVREEMKAFLSALDRAQLNHLAIKHPLAGPFSYRDFLSFAEWHLRHHRRQIRRIRTSPAFPH